MFASKEQVEQLKQRALQWERGGCPSGDTLIKDVMPLLNKLPGIAVVWSCEGHPPKENFYIMFAVEEDQFKVMQDMYNRLYEKLLPYQIKADAIKSARSKDETIPIPDNFSRIQYLELTFAKRISPFDMEWYSVINLNANTDTPGSKEVFFKEFKEVLNSLIN